MKLGIDRKNKCYRTKDYKRHNTIISRPMDGITKERWEEIFGPDSERRERFKKQAEEQRKQRELREVNAPTVSIYDPEWSVLATGKRMTKRQLKEYCKINGKIMVQ